MLKRERDGGGRSDLSDLSEGVGRAAGGRRMHAEYESIIAINAFFQNVILVIKLI